MDSGTLYQDDSEEIEFVVEDIVGRRTNKNQLEYLVKWKEFPDEDNTWELSKTLDCRALISKFEARRRRINIIRWGELKKDQLYAEKAKKLKIEPSTVVDNAFDCGYKAEEILYAVNSGNKISFVIRFVDLDEPEQVDADVAYAHAPQLVLKFYELHLKDLHAFPDCPAI